MTVPGTRMEAGTASCVKTQQNLGLLVERHAKYFHRQQPFPPPTPSLVSLCRSLFYTTSVHLFNTSVHVLRETSSKQSRASWCRRPARRCKPVSSCKR